MPKRVQIRYDRPWRPQNPDAVRVDFLTPWINPYRVGHIGVPDAQKAVELFEYWCGSHEGNRQRIREALAGRDLACRCPLDTPCHADVLLRIANQDPVSSRSQPARDA